MAILRQLLKRTLNAILPEHWWLSQGPRRCGAVALTFDDGPDPEWTPLVLDHLKRFDMRATFFVIGRKAAQFPDLVRRMTEEGHEVGNHSYFHGEPSRTSSDQFLAETVACRSLLADLTRRNVTSFRPPKGELDVRKMLGLWQLRQTVVLWNIDSRDFTFSDVSEFEAWNRSYAPASGDLILMHDDRAVTAAGLPCLLESIRDRRLQCVTISSWSSSSKMSKACSVAHATGVAGGARELTPALSGDEPSPGLAGAPFLKESV